MPSSRLSLRLGQLPHDVLADLAARLCSDSPALQAAAEECMAAHKPLSHELVERVLLSPDLVPSVLGPLEAKDWAAAAVCSQWLAGWQATNEPPWPRRRLKQVPLELPEEIDTSGSLDMTATPDGRLVVRDGFKVHILDRSMRALQTVARSHYCQLAASDDSIFSVQFDGDEDERLCRCSHDGTAEAVYQLQNYAFSLLLLAGGLLFCVATNEQGNGEHDEIIALDAQTLQLRHRFGLGLLDGAQEMCVAGDELHVCDAFNDRLQVFSLTGEHRRSVTGEWRSPVKICFAQDRLYLVERRDDVHDAPRGHRLLVLSLQGDILQVVMNAIQPDAFFRSICCFDGQLLAYYKASDAAPGSPSPPAHGVLAFHGL
jgi:hypothetical protein